jgi:hypothetical protein
MVTCGDVPSATVNKLCSPLDVPLLSGLSNNRHGAARHRVITSVETLIGARAGRGAHCGPRAARNSLIPPSSVALTRSEVDR